MAVCHGLLISLSFKTLREEIRVNNTYSILLIVIDCLYIVYFCTALVIFTLSLRKLRRLLQEHSETGTNDRIAVLHTSMITLLIIGRLCSDAIEAMIWVDSLGFNIM